MHILYLKALHIIFVITWFAGLFYSVRLFIYYAEAEDKEEPSKSILQIQYKIMSKRLWYIITWPSAILASLFAFWMLYLNPYYLSEPWMLVKLSFVFALSKSTQPTTPATNSLSSANLRVNSVSATVSAA